MSVAEFSLYIHLISFLQVFLEASWCLVSPASDADQFQLFPECTWLIQATVQNEAVIG